jgi:nucleobase:cation symporter-1, NCS1 family
MADATGSTEARPLQIEANGINVIAENVRKGRPRDLFWPWFAANVSVLGLSYGAFELDFGISFAQALVVGVVGIVLSFLACGFIAVAGKRGSAPTMVLSRAAFGVRGNKLPTVISWLLTVGWETVLVILATLATATVFHRVGVGGGAWQGYLLGPFGLGGKTGAWAYANLGVLVALAMGFVAHLVFGRSDVRAEEAVPLPAAA